MDHLNSESQPSKDETLVDTIEADKRRRKKRNMTIGAVSAGIATTVVGAAVAWDAITGPNNEGKGPGDPTPAVSESWTPVIAPTEAPSTSPTPEVSGQIQAYESMDKGTFVALPWTERFDYNANIIPLDEKQKSRELWYEKSQNPEDIYPETINVNSSPEDILKISTDYLRQSITAHNIILDSSGIPNWDKIQNFDQEKAEKLLSAGFYYTDEGWYGRGADIIDELYNNGEASNGPDYYVLRNLAGVPDLVWASELYTLPGVDGQELPARFIEGGWDDLQTTGQTIVASQAYVWVEYPDDSPDKTADTPGTWLAYGHLVDRPAS